MTTVTARLNATLSKYHQKDGKYRNPARMRRGGLLKSLGIALRFLFAKPANTVPGKPLPVHALSAEQLFEADDNSLFRLGHSTLLLKLGGQFWLTDPVFSERASPVQWAGPQRFHAPPIAIADLPPIHGVILSHDHYDHLDKAAVLALAERTTHFIAPLGVGDTLVSWGIPAGKVHQLDWWQSKHLDGVKLVATPAQHFSGRGMFDGNSTLWSSWVIETAHTRLFFSGDSGYFKGFKEIGELYGPFDLTMIETGAYDPQWPDVHMQPEESLQAHLDLRGKVLLPIHNGTFDLAMHAWHEPFERIVALARERELPIATPAIGKALSLTAPEAVEHWWLHAK
ncbi:MBL fold metallo-hydrolase [Duganella sp. FT3S]|uniref:MBL fold metallo-hydrolase n=1 Tax=Rugamonas fusca TaxID=2758568 RepID=A0A7W2EFQ7_9BURK|nr:MBL fold metallo-hydrolase [Rugamonas fusca]MBA5604976.1 MBL fold metallo-hydrolase [Rugamonas fusca]